MFKQKNFSIKIFMFSLIIIEILQSSECTQKSNTKDSYNNSFSIVETYQLPIEVQLNDSDECFENRIEAVEVGRQCSRRCRKDVPCENTRKQCLCDGLCGLSCIKPDLNCAELPKIEHGDYQPKSSKFNTKISYTCDADYYLFGSHKRLCQGDEDWSGMPAECLPEPLCRNPIKVNHARNPSDGTYRLNDRVNYSCYPGYQARNSSEAICKLIKKNHTAWVWTGAPFRCIPKSCGDPGHLENGKRHGDSFIIASSVLYTCNEGFEMIGQAKRYCQSDNQWSGQPPQCVAITCKPTDHLENGKINYAYPLVYNSTVEYSCDFGFKLVGPNKRICGPERKLIGDVPTCEEIDCGELGPLHNGYIKGFSTRMGDKKEFTCMEGMKFQGNYHESMCLESGKWSHPLPKCLGSCIVPRIEHASEVYIIQPELLMYTADVVSNSENVSLIFANLSNDDNNNSIATTLTATATTTTTIKNFTTFAAPAAMPIEEAEVGSKANHGSYLDVVCEHDYEFDERMDDNNVIQAPVCINSSWSYQPHCKPASCKSSPRSPKNGRIRFASIEHGSKGYIHCIDGFRLKGDNIIYCSKGNWTNIEAQCVEIYCPFPGVIENGRIQLVGINGMYDYRPYIKRISTNRQIAYDCEPGYRLSDGAPSYATCMDGRWKPDWLPSCVRE